eukprot:5056987-Karenia_brevis.AAC.1
MEAPKHTGNSKMDPPSSREEQVIHKSGLPNPLLVYRQGACKIGCPLSTRTNESRRSETLQS